jgi:hypothetical protein
VQEIKKEKCKRKFTKQGSYGVIRQVMFQYHWRRAVSGSLFVKWEDFFREFAGRSKAGGVDSNADSNTEMDANNVNEGKIAHKDHSNDRSKTQKEENTPPTAPAEGLAEKFVASIFTKYTMVASNGGVRPEGGSNQGQSGYSGVESKIGEIMMLRNREQNDIRYHLCTFTCILKLVHIRSHVIMLQCMFLSSLISNPILDSFRTRCNSIVCHITKVFLPLFE